MGEADRPNEVTFRPDLGTFTFGMMPAVWAAAGPHLRDTCGVEPMEVPEGVVDRVWIWMTNPVARQVLIELDRLAARMPDQSAQLRDTADLLLRALDQATTPPP